MDVSVSSGLKRSGGIHEAQRAALPSGTMAWNLAQGVDLSAQRRPLNPAAGRLSVPTKRKYGLP